MNEYWKDPNGTRTTKVLLASSRSSADQFRRQQADKAIARIEECYRRGLAIPPVN